MEKTLSYYVMVLRKFFTNYCSERLQEIGLTQGLLYFILYVGNHPECSPKELAQALSFDSGHVTRSIAKLEQGGFICQKKDENDRRSHVLHLLEKGEEAFRVSHELFTNWDNMVMKDISENDKAQLFKILDGLEKREMGNNCVRKNI